MTNGQFRGASRAIAFTYVTLSYITALVAALITGFYFRQQGYDILTTIAAADFIGTVVVFLFSFFFKNSSFYDPYWSVIPIIIAVYLALIGWDSGASQVRIGILLFLVSAWGIRLTYNWARGWRGLHQQDWRYDDLAEKTGKWYWLVSFSGIHLFPTILVYLGCLALYPAMTLDGQPLNFIDLIAGMVTLGAILIETVADEQLRRFVKQRKAPGQTLTSGLWAYSRHPNYFGETAFWWGLFLFAMAARPDYWWVITGPLAMTLLFNFISIPMIDQRMLKRRNDYQTVMKTVPRWIPWFPKESTEVETEEQIS